MPDPCAPIVLFDMDGVLVDVSGSYRRAIQETAAQFLGRPVAAEEVQRYKNRGGFNDDWRLTEAIIRDGGIDVPFDDIRTSFDLRYRGEAWNGFITREPPLMPLAVLREVQGRSAGTGIVTGRPRGEAEWTVHRFGWGPFFDVLVAMEDQDGRGKPDPYPMRVALTRFIGPGIDCSTDRTVYIGDSIDDMRSAKAAGVRAIGFVPPYLASTDLEQRLFVAGADLVIDTHDRLIEALESLFG